MGFGRREEGMESGELLVRGEGGKFAKVGDDFGAAFGTEFGGEGGDFLNDSLWGEVEGGGGEVAAGVSEFARGEVGFLERIPGEVFIGPFAAEGHFGSERGGVGGEFVEGEDEGVADREVHLGNDLGEVGE